MYESQETEYEEIDDAPRFHILTIIGVMMIIILIGVVIGYYLGYDAGYAMGWYEGILDYMASWQP